MNQYLFSCFRDQVFNIVFAVLAVAIPLIQDLPKDETPRFIQIEGAIVKIIDSAKVPAEVSGVLLELTYREGQQVQKGDLLAKIKSSDLSLEHNCLLYTSPSPRDATLSRMPSSA